MMTLLAVIVDAPRWFVELDQSHSAYVLLATLAAFGVAVGLLHQFGVLGWALGVLGVLVRGSIRRGFLLWARLFGWAPWPGFLAIAGGLLIIGESAGASQPSMRVLCGLGLLFMGTAACLAYMFIDLERYEVERGYKAVHNPLKGQELAVHLARYGRQVGVPLLIAATAAVVADFAELNLGLYDTVGRDWYRVGDEREGPTFLDFLAFALIKLLGIIDVLDLARSRHFLQTTYVQPARWPASMMLAGFRSFFTLVLLQQIFASVRQGKLLAETITDFWSPHEPIHERARNALPQYGAVAIGPLLVSLRSMDSLTKEQRDQLPTILATIGPTTIPALVRHLGDSHEHVRAIAAAALGRLHSLDSVPLLTPLIRDKSDFVRQSVVEALGDIGEAGAPSPRRGRRLHWPGRGSRWLFWRRQIVPTPPADLVGLAVATLRSALTDESAAVRTQTARALGRCGATAAAVAADLERSSEWRSDCMASGGGGSSHACD